MDRAPLLAVVSAEASDKESTVSTGVVLHRPNFLQRATVKD